MSVFLTQIIYRFAQTLRKLGVDFGERNNSKIREMQMKINQLGGIKFKIEIYPDNSWVAESINIDGIITGSKDIKEKNSFIRDATFTYFEISPKLCNDKLIKTDDEAMTITQKVHAYA